MNLSEDRHQILLELNRILGHRKVSAAEARQSVFEVALPEGLNRGQAGQTDNATGRVESDGGAELYTEAVGEFTQDALGAEH